MFSLFKSKDQLRQQAREKARHPVMIKYLAREFPAPETAWDQVEIVSLDFETTGLDPQRHQILSYGKVHIRQGTIHLSTARHDLIRSEGFIPEASAVIHHITDDEVRTARTIEQVLPELLHDLGGKVMLVHYRKIEQAFLNAACQKLYGSPFIIPTIDTLVLSQRVLKKRNYLLEPHHLRLFNLRNNFALPVYKAHNALNDAMTTAELFLVLEGEISPNTSTALKRLLV